MDKQNLGKIGENLASAYLITLGYKILEKNFRSKLGEIDIIALEANTLVFVEVKTRFSEKFGTPEEAVKKSKLKTIEGVGHYFRFTHPSLPEAERIDVVAIEFDSNGNVIRKELIKNVSF